MSEFVHLVGAEDVKRAAGSMVSAATEISQAVANLEGILQRHRDQMNEWLERFEQAVAHQ